MAESVHEASLEEQIDQWRRYLARRQAIQRVDVAELEDHLREQISVLSSSGLSGDEAFLIGVKRMGDLDAVSREFAREHSERLWKQLVMSSPETGEQPVAMAPDAIAAVGFAVAAAAAVKLPVLFGKQPDTDAVFYLRNASLFVLPLVTAYFAWKRRLDARTLVWLALVFVLAAVAANIHPVGPDARTEALTVIHLPIALWLTVGVAYAATRWRDVAGRMDFIRFSGELFIYYVLIALGGAVLTAFLLMMFEAIGIKLERFVQAWLIPCGAAGAVLIASWLVEAKQSVIENMAPVLTRIFTPLFTAVLVTFLATLLWTRRGVGIEPQVLIAFDLLLVVVLGLVLYAISARDAGEPAGAFDRLQLLLLVSALAADVFALWAIAARISEFGLTPNRVAALGENIILLVNLAWSAVLYGRFLRRNAAITALERWQTRFMPVYAVWAAIVVIVFPPLFGFV